MATWFRRVPSPARALTRKPAQRVAQLLALLVCAACDAELSETSDAGLAPQADAVPPPPDGSLPPVCEVPPSLPSGGPATTPTYSLRILDSYPLAVCNDGSQATYAIRRNPDSSRWVIYLEGSGACHDATSCRQRWNGDGAHTMSSSEEILQASRGTYEAPATGILSPDPAVSPMFSDANVVRIHYCSSDDWLGDRAGDDSLPAGNSRRWHFRGRRIVEATLRDLLGSQGLDHATEVVLGGSGAGGIGVYGLADDVHAMLRPGVRFLGVSEGGFVLPGEPAFDPATGQGSTASPTLGESRLASAAALWQGRGDESCTIAAGQDRDARLACYRPDMLVSHGHVATRLLIIQSQWDAQQLRASGIALDEATGTIADPAQRAYAHRYAAAVRSALASVDPRHSVFAPYSYLHGLCMSSVPLTSPIDGVELLAAVESFWQSPCEVTRLIQDEDPQVP